MTPNGDGPGRVTAPSYPRDVTLPRLLCALLLLACAQHGLAQDAKCQVRLRSGAMVSLHVELFQRTSMWHDASLLHKGYRDLYALDGGASEPRLIYHNSRNYGLSGFPTTTSADGAELYVWLDCFSQLVALDPETGRNRRLTDLPTHVNNYEFRQHMDPKPVARAGGVVTDDMGHWALFLVQEETNGQVSFWQRSAARTGGHWLVAVDLSDGLTVDLCEPLEGRVLGWELSLARNSLYLVLRRDGALKLLTRRLNGALVGERELSFVGRSARRLVLSPDQRTLLIERCFFPDARSEDTAEGLGQIADANDAPEQGGFVLLDLETGKVTNGPARGYHCAWSPTGETIALMDHRQLWLFDVATHATTLVASREPANPDGRAHLASTPVWSEDGARLLAHLGGDYGQGTPDNAVLLFDLPQQEFMLYVMPADIPPARGFVWCSVPEPVMAR